MALLQWQWLVIEGQRIFRILGYADTYEEVVALIANRFSRQQRCASTATG